VPLIDDWLPEFDVGELHDVAVPLEPDLALELALGTPAAPDRIVRALIKARGMVAETRRSRASSQRTASSFSTVRRPSGSPARSARSGGRAEASSGSTTPKPGVPRIFPGRSRAPSTSARSASRAGRG